MAPEMQVCALTPAQPGRLPSGSGVAAVACRATALAVVSVRACVRVRAQFTWLRTMALAHTEAQQVWHGTARRRHAVRQDGRNGTETAGAALRREINGRRRRRSAPASGGVQHAEAAMCYLSMCATMAHMLSVRDPSKERVFPAAVFKKVNE